MSDIPCELPQKQPDRTVLDGWATSLTLCVLAFLGGGRQNLLNQQTSLCLREEGEEPVRGLGGALCRVWCGGGPGAGQGGLLRHRVELGVGGREALGTPLPAFPTFSP